MNILADSMPSNEFTPEQALFGFQDDGPLWERQDAGELEPTDASPEFMSTLNELVEASGGTIWFRAPFLDLRLNKLMVFKLALDVGVPLEATSSCIQGWMSKCGVCPQCMTRAAAARALGVSE
jgi:7-cyano-7-deazaguanine synthase in queuosine biosynthesis